MCSGKRCKRSVGQRVPVQLQLMLMECCANNCRMHRSMNRMNRGVKCRRVGGSGREEQGRLLSVAIHQVQFDRFYEQRLAAG